MKKLVTIFALLLCVLMVFASCGAEKPLKLDKDALNESNVLTNVSSKELTAVAGYTYNSGCYNLAMFTKLNSDGSTIYKVVNIKSGAVIKEKTISADDRIADRSSIYLSTKGSFIISKENGTYTLYKADGTSIGTAKTEPTFVNDCAVIGETVYRYDTKTLENKDTYSYSSLNGELPSATGYQYSNYYICPITNGFAVYNNHYEYIGEYVLPGYAVDGDYFVLKNGNVLVQYRVTLPDDAKKYDLVINGVKYDLVQKIVKAKNLSEKDVSLDYYVLELNFVDSESNFFKKNIDNVAYVSKIENKMYDENAAITVSMSNKGKTRIIYDEQYLSYYPIGNGYLMATTKSDINFILDKNLNVVAKVSNLETYTEKYLLTDTAIYDYDLKKLADLNVSTDVKYIYDTRVGNNFIFYEYDENGHKDYYIYNGAFTKIADYSEGQTSVNCYNSSMYTVSQTVDNVTTTKLYNSSKSEIATYNGSFSKKATLYGENDEISVIVSAGDNFYVCSASKPVTTK